jgi:hypothetical protein
MDSYDKIYEQYELCKSYYLRIDRLYQQNFEISGQNKLLVEKHYIEDLKRLNLEFRSSYIKLHLLIDSYGKQFIKLNTENVTLIKLEIERYRALIDNIVKLIERLTC